MHLVDKSFKTKAPQEAELKGFSSFNSYTIMSLNRRTIPPYIREVCMGGRSPFQFVRIVNWILNYAPLEKWLAAPHA